MTHDVILPPDIDRPIGTILHLGAGSGAALGDYLAHPSARIVLVEPMPERAAGLRDMAAALPPSARARVEILEAAVAEADGRAMLSVFNQSDASSLPTATGLFDLYPGLRVLQRTEVETIGPAGLAARLTFDPDALNWLIIDTPGVEAQVLRAMADQGLLARFGRIDLCCGTEPLYEGALSAGKILTWLVAQGYLPDLGPEDADPDLCERRLTLNPALPRIRMLEAECAELKGLVAKREAALAEAAQERAEQQDSATAAQADTLSKSEAAAAAQAEQIRILTATLEARARELEASNGARKALGEQAEGLRKENAALAANIDDLTTSLSASEAAQVALSARLAQTESEAAEQVGTLTAALEGKAKALEASIESRKSTHDQAEAVRKERDDLKSKNADLAARLLEAGQVTRSDLIAAHAQQDALRTELQETRAALQTSQAQQAQLAQSRDDIVRAEGQIALIKDLLLSGPEL